MALPAAPHPSVTYGERARSGLPFNERFE